MLKHLEFDHHEALADAVETVPQALVVPFNPSNPRRPKLLGGVVRADGSFVDASNCYISPDRQVNLPLEPQQPADAPIRPGTWLFGGKLDNRFGHFLQESLGRLWAEEFTSEPVSGVVYLPKRAFSARRAKRQLARVDPLFGLIADMLPREMLTEPMRFERLIVAPQGSGTLTMAPGCPEFRDFMRTRFAKHVVPDGPEKLYVSRTKLRLKPGTVLFEHLIEEAAAAEGYEIFHPQDHSLDVQISRYRAAKYILGIEGSALHLAALSHPRGAKTGLICRRTGPAPVGFANQLTEMSGVPCVTFHRIERNFRLPGRDKRTNTILDTAGLLSDLWESGFFSKQYRAPQQTPEQILVAMNDFKEQAGLALQ